MTFISKSAPCQPQSAPGPQLPPGKRTTLELYATAKEAHERWTLWPAKVRVVDVRTPEEYLFVGHPAMAWKIPIASQSYEWDAAKGKFPMALLPDFVDRVREMAKPEDVLLAFCRSGGRSAMAANILAKAGFTNVTNIGGLTDWETAGGPVVS